MVLQVLDTRPTASGGLPVRAWHGCCEAGARMGARPVKNSMIARDRAAPTLGPRTPHVRPLATASYSLLLLSLVAGAGCVDPGASSDEDWVLLTEDEPSALLSVWSAGDSDVWAVGGDDREESEQGPLVLHHDETGWQRLEAGVRDVDLWWVFGFAGGPVLLGGSAGTILRARSGQLEEPFSTPSAGIVFGMWGAAPEDVWAVGQTPEREGFVWHFDGTAWSDVPLPAGLDGAGPLFKVSGRSADDVWMCGADGVVLRFRDGGPLERVDLVDGSGSRVTATLLSIGLNSERVVVAGGDASGVVYEHDGAGWTAATLPTDPGGLWRGVAMNDDDAFVVGDRGQAMRRLPGGSWSFDEPQLTGESLHAAWLDPGGTLWAVGGKFTGQPTSDGVLIRRGGAVPEVTR